jgi:two-component system, cell cycle sensor histidine kinase and response regulator CckA
MSPAEQLPYNPIATLQAVVKVSPAAIAVTDLEGRVLLWNRAAEIMFGWIEAEVLGQVLPIIALDRQAELRNSIAAMLQAPNSSELEVWRRRKDDTLIATRMALSPIFDADNRLIGIVEIHQDITDQKKADARLQRQTEILQTIIDYIPVMISFFDTDGRFLLVNREWERVLGWSIEEMNAQPDMLALFYPDPEAYQAVLEYMLSGQAGWHEFKTTTRDGRVIDTMWANVRLADGTSIGIGQDVTEQKNLEAQYRQAHKMEAVGRLASGIAHDFNNLLVPIIGYIELSMMDVDPDSKLYADLHQVRKAADRATSLTRQILAFSRRQMLDVQLLNFNTLIEDIRTMIQRLIGDDVELRTLLAPELPLVKADRGQMEQILLNLLINARDAMPDGGCVTLETAEVYLDAAYATKYAENQAPGPYVMLAVSDSGHGMDEATLQQIFEPFFTTKEPGRGTGLGLSTVFGIVKQHGGAIWVYSEPGAGATFKIYLPQAEGNESTTTNQARDPASYKGSETILVVEHEDMVRQIVGETLSAYGYEVLETINPMEALRLATAHQAAIHLLLTDVIMPVMNGRELFEALRHNRPELAVLYMSGYTDDVIVYRGILDAGIHFLQKPFSIESLTCKVRQILSAQAQ